MKLNKNKKKIATSQEIFAEKQNQWPFNMAIRKNISIKFKCYDNTLSFY